MKLIFLDIDGVLNTSETFRKRYYEYKKTGILGLEIDEFRLNYLKKIVEKTNAKIVLSSTWRNYFIKKNNNIIPVYYKSKQLVDVFNKYNLDIYDITPHDKNRYRENEILKYLENRVDVESFIVIDDECADLKSFVNNELILIKNDCTSFCEEENGLLEAHIFDALNRLNSKVYCKKIIIKRSREIYFF